MRRVVGRQLRQAAKDPRYAFGETLLTVWPPPQNFAGMNAVTRVLHCEDSGRADRTVTIPTPVFHVLGLLSDLGDRYWVLPQQTVAGHVVAGFGSQDERGVVRIVLYARHHADDTQSRSQATFDIALDLDHLGWDGAARCGNTVSTRTTIRISGRRGPSAIGRRAATPTRPV